MKKIFALTALAVSMFAANASAATVTYDYTTDPSGAYGTGYTFQTTSWEQLLSLPKFNLAGKVLDSAVLTYMGGFQSSGDLDSEDAQAQHFVVNVGVDLSFWGDGTNGSDNVGFSDTGLIISKQLFNGNLAADSDGAPDFAGTDSATGLTVAKEGANNTVGLTLASVIGAGNFSVDVLANSFFGVTGSANLASNINTDARAKIAVTYTYHDAPTQTPEPATLALMGLGLAGFAVARKRKQA